MRKYCFFPVIFVIAAIMAAAQVAYPVPSEAEQPARFTSMNQLLEYIKANRHVVQYGYGFGRREMLVDLQPRGMVETGTQNAKSLDASPAPMELKKDESFSTTNNQVAGVDEADILKSDGRYLYVVAGGLVHIIEAYPAGSSRIVSSIKCDGYPQELFLNGDRLMVISRRTAGPGMLAAVYDIKDRSLPAPVRTLAWEGDYVSSRLIGKFAYLVINLPVNVVTDAQGEPQSVSSPKITENGRDRVIPPEEIYYFNYPDFDYRYTVIVSVDMLDTGREALCRTFLTGTSQNIYCSPENLYLTGPKNPDAVQFTNRFIDEVASLAPGETSARIKGIAAGNLPVDQKMVQLESVLEGYLETLDYSARAVLEEKLYSLREKLNRDMERERNKTVIHKLSVKNGDIAYSCRGEVGGRLLNQFSMDEHEGYFRVATTSEGWLFFDSPVSRNNLYVLDGSLNVVGRLEGLAPQERIYSARFMGDRVYLVTFRNIDPLFVIDLKNPSEPKVLGQLKIPGFSDYLHPYDENHLIGVGKEVAAVEEPADAPALSIMPPLPRQQGVKIALFDVTNPEKPVEMAKYVVDQPGANSEVSSDHRSFLFSRTRNLMALPVSYAVSPTVSQKAGYMPRYWQWQGMYVFNISTADGIKLKGKIEHPSQATDSAYAYTEAVRRAAYINDVFYTVSEGAVKLSGLDSLKEIKMIKLPANTENVPPYPVKLMD